MSGHPLDRVDEKATKEFSGIDCASYLPDHVLYPDPTVYRTGTPLYLDFETTNFSKGSALDQRNRLVLAVWKEGAGPLCHKFGGEFDQQELLAAIERCDYIVAHNAKFELQWLARCGVDLGKLVVYDTMIADYVLGGNRWTLYALGLESCLIRHGFPGKESMVSRMIKAGICPSEIPVGWLLAYCERDVTALVDLMGAQLASLSGTRLLPVLYNRCLLTPVLADIETQGLQLDADLVHTKYTELTAQWNELTARMNAMTGGINPNSHKQATAYLYDTLGFEELKIKRGGKWVPKTTDGGGRCKDADTVLALVVKTKAQQDFKDLYIELNDCHQQLSKYFNKFEACCNEAGGVLFADFNQCNTVTHRLSSTGREYSAQFQNFPRAWKKIFKARRDGYLMAEADGAQLEFRVAAHLGRCVKALLDIENDVDVHVFTAGVLTDAGQPTSRQDAKPHTFKPLYGGQSGTKAEQAYYSAFREKYPGITATQNNWISYVLEHKKLETEWGLVYYWPDTKMDRSGYISNTTSICNFPVQAFATAEIIPAALVMMWHVIRGAKLRIHLVNTIHDSIIGEAHPDEVGVFHEVSKWCLINGSYGFIEKLYGIKLVCRLGCGIKVATHWGDTKEELKYEADPSLYREAA